MPETAGGEDFLLTDATQQVKTTEENTAYDSWIGRQISGSDNGTI